MKEVINLIPLYDRVVVERLKQHKTESGIILPDMTTEKTYKGVVLAVGVGKQYKDFVQKPIVKKGDIVLFNRYSGTELLFDENEIIVLKEEDILGILKN